MKPEPKRYTEIKADTVCQRCYDEPARYVQVGEFADWLVGHKCALIAKDLNLEVVPIAVLGLN